MNPDTPQHLVRLVRMTFHPDARENFLTLFDEAAPRIRTVDGCHHLELWSSVRHVNILTTYSHWSDQEALDRYRRSTLFKETWAKARQHFAAPPVAHSYRVERAADTIAATSGS